MNLVRFEIDKMLNRRIALVLFFVTVILFPIFIKIISELSVTEDHVPEEQFADHVAWGIIAFLQLPFFLPVWIIIFIGLELSNGHVNRVVFARSRKFYFLSKIVFCGIITMGYSIIGLLSIIIALKTSPFQHLDVDPIFYGKFLLQLVFSTFGYAVLLLSMVFIFRSPTTTFIVYLSWPWVESIIYILIKSRYDIDANWLPFHLIKTFYSRTGEPISATYYMPSVETWNLLLLPICFILLLILIVWRHFSKSDLKSLSD